ncbi:hypothetical protein MJ904_08050 [Massilia sp. MB5]|uniref:hypothetical protein n=1 Tax=unclassified Massilia TaxID=2609279 RepID=UPI00067E206F|nr:MULTISPECIES: hypothetical protein [unclassified Massilia]AKU23020.1 hypothetical protein ACZ75_17715 [Massilia sp. NR 4-1]UMR32116.1 hypothetical protein MJ904_08050 [Massilia sp. MB5]
MNIAKHMEAIFIVAAVLGGASAMATAAVPASVKASTPVVAKAAASDMQVVTITAKRLSAAEKAAL